MIIFHKIKKYLGLVRVFNKVSNNNKTLFICYKNGSCYKILSVSKNISVVYVGTAKQINVSFAQLMRYKVSFFSI